MPPKILAALNEIPKHEQIINLINLQHSASRYLTHLEMLEKTIVFCK
jgi:hypothetical protein